MRLGALDGLRGSGSVPIALAHLGMTGHAGVGVARCLCGSFAGTPLAAFWRAHGHRGPGGTVAEVAVPAIAAAFVALAPGTAFDFAAPAVYVVLFAVLASVTRRFVDLPGRRPFEGLAARAGRGTGRLPAAAAAEGLRCRGGPDRWSEPSRFGIRRSAAGTRAPSSR